MLDSIYHITKSLERHFFLHAKLKIAMLLRPSFHFVAKY